MLRAVAMLVAGLAVMFPFAAQAEEYPARPVKLIVPFAAGGPADIYARFLAQRLEVALGQPFIVDDRPGAGSVIGTDAAAKSAPDGYALLVMSNTHTVNETLVPNKPYALLRDFVHQLQAQRRRGDLLHVRLRHRNEPGASFGGS